MHAKMLARLGAVVFIGFIIVATAIGLSRRDDPSTGSMLEPQMQTIVDPLRLQLRRCRDLGEAAIRDQRCPEIWSANRDRFLQQKSKPAADDLPAQQAPPAQRGAR
ncbi:putative entry exclusion protein TrbK-alt [Agrobacterium rhizogenes]|jgi:conjugative transfer region protein TrbK|nr:putative entry exclusion protein TrbK-alt [Rhizobium rhizogenes]NTJ77785.1 putative entry exclusion protein TrbK-alt [Rhizobium rhizogenes]